MRPIPPATLTRNLTNTEQRAVTQWWRGLDRPARRALRVLLDERATAAPRAAVGRLVDPRAPHVATTAFPEIDLYEYIVNHELVFVGPPVFHICVAHEAARAAVAARRIPAAFRCPFARTDCPMRAIVEHAGHRDVRLAFGRCDLADPSRDSRDRGAA